MGKQAICQILCSARSTRPSLLKVGNRPQAKPELRFPQQDPRRLVGTTRPLAKPQRQELCLPQAISHPSALHKTKTLASTVGTQRPLAKQDPCLLVGTLQTSLHTSATSQTGTWFSTQVIDHSNSENGIIISHQFFTTHMGLKQRQSAMD